MIELLFETRGILLSLGESATASASLSATITIELSMFPQKKIYLPSGRILEKARWQMIISETVEPQPGDAGSMGAVTTEQDGDIDHCFILINPDSARFAELREMFKGGHASEITVGVDGLTDNNDFSKKWDTGRMPALTVQSISFDFPLPQSEA